MTRCGSKLPGLSGAAATIVLLAPADLLGFGFHRRAVRLERIGSEIGCQNVWWRSYFL
jgi:hypothetical protein